MLCESLGISLVTEAGSWNQDESKKAPHPQVTEASDESEMSGWEFLSSVIIDRPFHCLMKQLMPPHNIGLGLFVEVDKRISALVVGGYQRIDEMHV